MVEPKVGQVWGPRDPREMGRTVRVDEVSEVSVRVTVLTPMASNPHGRVWRCLVSDTVDLDKAIRADLAERARETDQDAPSRSKVAYAGALRALLDRVAEWETDFEGRPSIYGRAFADEVRAVVARELGVADG